VDKGYRLSLGDEPALAALPLTSWYFRAKFSDIRRVARVKTIAAAMASHPGRSVPQLCNSLYAVKAAYNLFNHEEATPANIQAGHWDVVRAAMSQAGVYLVLEDTTELSWSGKQAMEGLGSMGHSAQGLQDLL
jgi:hypothetical protein